MGIFLSLGSNKRNKAANIKLAISLLENNSCKVLKTSGSYTTKAWGKTDQDDFLNAAIEIKTELSPIKLLDTIQAIELKIGRQRVEKWGPRLIDIDILLFNDLIIDSDKLTIPHPYLHKRNFVLIPLLEISYQLYHPKLKKTIESLYLECDDLNKVTRIDS